jgi:hypothetical protein
MTIRSSDQLPDGSEADVLEQRAELPAPGTEVEPDLPVAAEGDDEVDPDAEADPADLAEQARAVPLDDDDDRR